MFWELAKAIFGPKKDKWWIRGSKTPKPPEMPLKQGKTSQHHNWPRYMGLPQIEPKNALKLGEKCHKDKWYLFRAPTGGSADFIFMGLGIFLISRNDFANSRNPARNNSSEKILHNDKNGHCAHRFLEACYQNNKKAMSKSKIAQSARK